MCTKARRVLNRMDHLLSSLMIGNCPLRGNNLGLKLHPGGGCFGPWSFIILKSSHQDLSNEGLNFILSQVEDDR